MPSFAKRLIDLYPNQIRVLYLIYENIKPQDKALELMKHVKDMENPWFNEMTMEELNELCSYLTNESKRIRIACENYKIDYIEVDDITKSLPLIKEKLLS